MKHLLPFLFILLGCGHKVQPTIETISGHSASIAKFTLVNGVRHGPAVIAYRDVLRYGVYHNGLKEGVWRVYWKDTLQQVLAFHEGLFHGRILKFWSNGNLEQSIYMQYGLRHGKERAFYRDGTPFWVTSSRKGQRQGNYYKWNRKDTANYGVYSTGRFENGLRQGVWRSYYSNGVKRHEVPFVNDNRHGEVYIWNRDGHLEQTKLFQNGKQIAHPVN